ncbi:MAG: hypothetical protein ACRDD1_21180, partial [Planctomycetia bacterium]
LLHRKSPEYMAFNAAGNTAAGAFLVADKSEIIPGHDETFYVGGVSAIWNYSADEDAWMQLPNSGATGTFGAGACGEFRGLSAPAGVITSTATGGTTTTINTALTLVRNLAGCVVRLVGGPGIGLVTTIVSNTLGANAIITLASPASTAVTAATQYQFFGGSLWFFNSGAGAVGFSVYDRATNVWTARSVTGIPTTWGTDAQLLSTSGIASNNGLGFVNGTATAGAGSTLTDGAKTWPVNGWTNAQIRITGGTGAGQIRTIASNTATVITVSVAWTTNPDATSVYRIEGNDEHFYLLGNNAVTAYRYSITANTWATLAPVAARAGALATGGTADWIDEVSDATWTNGLYGNHISTTVIKQLGRYLYSFRGGGANILDIYDIAGNTWISGVAYGGQLETFGAGSHSVDAAGIIYIQKEATGRIYHFHVNENCLQPFTQSPVPQGAAVVGDKMIIQTFTEGATKIRYLYSLTNTSNAFTRWLII